VTGTVPAVGSVALNYECGADRAAGIIRNDGARIQVDYGARDGSGIAQVAVQLAWWV
jgi:hypothetical protein